MRTARSMRSLTRSTARSTVSRSTSMRGWRDWKSTRACVSTESANDRLVVTRSLPVASLRRTPATACRSAASSSIWRRRGSASSPAALRLTRRVVRCSSRAPSQRSRLSRWRLTIARDRSRFSAARVRLPWSAISTKARMALSWSMGLHRFRLTIISMIRSLCLKAASIQSRHRSTPLDGDP